MLKVGQHVHVKNSSGHTEAIILSVVSNNKGDTMYVVEFAPSYCTSSYVGVYPESIIEAVGEKRSYKVELAIGANFTIEVLALTNAEAGLLAEQAFYKILETDNRFSGAEVYSFDVNTTT